MALKKVTAIFDELRLKEVERALISHGVSSFTVRTVKGRGRYFDAFNENHLTRHIQMDVYTSAEHARAIALLIVNTAHVNADSEGLVSVLPVDELYWIHDRQVADDSEFNFHEQI